MKIVLLRHGQPDFEQKWVAPGNGSKYSLDRYAASNVTTEPPAELRKIHLPDEKCVSSTLARSVDSARLLGYSNCVSHKLFNESDLPYPNRLLVPLPWSVFLAIYRFLWLVGFKQNCPGRSADEDRAYEASHILADLASVHGSVVLVGHGIFNRLMCSELKKKRWSIVSKNGSGYWSSIVLSKDGVSS